MATTNLTRRAFLGAAGAAGLTLAACGGNEAATDDAATTDVEAADGALTGTYAMHVQGYDYGAGVDKVTIGVFENNEPAHKCYAEVGFKDKEIVENCR